MFHFYSFDSRARERWQSLAEGCQRRLTEQHIMPGDPGTILKDIQTMLEFIGPRGVVTKSRNATFPAESLPELNAKVSHPIKLGLKRALLQDYPNLAGLVILVRVMELVEVKGKRVVLGPMALDFWPGLNSTEQYFALLEALLLQAQSSVLGGERRRVEEPAMETCRSFWVN